MAPSTLASLLYRVSHSCVSSGLPAAAAPPFACWTATYPHSMPGATGIDLELTQPRTVMYFEWNDASIRGSVATTDLSSAERVRLE